MAKMSKKESIGLTCIAGFFFLLVILSLIFDSESGELTEKAKSSIKATERKLDEIEKAFSAWDGSHYELTKYVKERMHDAGSFKHVSSTWRESDSGTIIVTMVYSGNNAYGARVKSQVEAKALVSGELVQVY